MAAKIWWIITICLSVLFTNPVTITSASNQFSGSMAAPRKANLTITNKSSREVCYLYVVASGSRSWGADVLGDNTIPSGESSSFTINEGYYNLRADDCENNTIQTLNNGLIKGNITWTIKDPYSFVEISVVNRTEQAICSVYISPANSNSWGSNLLQPKQSIPAGKYLKFEVIEGIYDLKADDCRGKELASSRNVEVSSAITWTLRSQTPKNNGSSGNSSSSTNNETGEQVYRRLVNGERIDFNTLNCAQLKYLASKYESIAKSAERASNGDSPAAIASAQTAIQAYNRLSQVNAAIAKKGCS